MGLSPNQSRGWSAGRHGGIVGYPLEQLYQEVAYIALHFHWSRDDILALGHQERRLWVAEISHQVE
ncbi:MAG: hypothetical protein EA366_11165 [Spirulina sp. DLM2.Bin59]|nr:MAG: hypothetical protein EA366_11165 [Spirulina sp. DLM2.Bin59]